MASYSKHLLSGSTNGRGIKITQTSIGSGDTIHTAVSGTASYDEVWIWAYNSSGSPILLTLGWGGTSSPDDLIQVTLAGQGGLILVAPGLLLQNSLIIKAAAGSANLVDIHGFVNRIV